MIAKQNTRCWCSVLAVAGLWPATTLGVGFRLPNQDPEAIGRANAYAATADNPSAIYYNPAGITQLQGQNLRVGVYAVSPGIEFKPSTTNRSYRASSDFQLVPQLYYTVTPKDLPLSFGLGVYCPYGLALDWGQNTPFRSEAEKGKLTYVTINPVAAWKVLTNLSIGAGPTINYSQADFTQGIGFLPNDRFHLEGDGWGYGFNAGALWQPHPQWSFGLNYRSVTTINYQGTAEIGPAALPIAGSTSADASIRFPQFAVAGVSFRPTPKWNIEFDLDWTDWDSVNQIPMHHTPVGSRVWPLNYTSSFMYEIGVTRQLPKGFFVSLGYFYSENSSPDKDFNSLIPDTDLHLGSLGFGRKGRRFDWTVAYHFGYNPGREVRNATTFPQANGTCEVFNQAINLAVTFKL